MRTVRALGVLLALMAAPVAAQTLREFNPKAPVAAVPHVGSAHASAPLAAAAVSPPTRAELTKTDVDTWLDGFVPYAIDQGDIAGAVVVVVKDGQVLTARGFGYSDIKAHKPVDPTSTLFRPGSISKLFTWTAVMQLVQAGKLDLDRDINDYLDFKIPPAFGRPITIRNLMTHTAGFEETAKYLVVFDPKQKLPLDRALKRWIPKRIYAPGAMPAYSNYGASLAGYIVQRISGEPFDTYVKHHIFDPLGMRHSTFEEPLPPSLAPDMAQGYSRASVPPDGFEILSLTPAGALSASGDDMARFMIAHLSGGGPLLDPKTTALMHAPANTPIPGLPSMALGFYREDRNGLNIAGHGGDLVNFHSDLHLFLDKGVGLYMSFNSAGKDAAAHTVRQRLFNGFVERYFPTSGSGPTLSSAKADGRAMVGAYVSSRASATNFLKFANLLGSAKVALNPDNTITVSALLNAAGVPKRWREVGPYQWAEVGGSDRLAAKVQDGRVLYFAPAGFAPIFEFLPDRNASWMVLGFYGSLAVMFLTGLAWPVVAFVRWRYKYHPELSGRARLLHYATGATGWALLLVGVGWIGVIQSLSSSAHAFDGGFDVWMRLLQLLLLIGIVGAVLSVWNGADTVVRPRKHLLSSIGAVITAASALYLVWFYIVENFLTMSLNY